ncbi:hypothetical protein PQX77_008628 [Marasmius sp. AFHP31]|nr:hypothetical protein PQX77_008628 [Marasmius sp. AFHP31]
MTLNVLPPELLDELCETIETGKDLKVFRLVNKRINDVASRHLWNTKALVIDLNLKKLRSGMEMLEDLKDRCKTSENVRALKIIRLDPRIIERSFTTSEREMMKRSRERLVEVLPQALSALRNLLYAYWKISSDDMPSALNQGEETWRQIVIEPLSQLTQLNTLVLSSDATLGLNLMSLDGFTNLERLTVKGRWNIDAKTLETNLAPLLSKNRKLHSLRLSLRYGSPDFRLLFPETGNEHSGPQLEHLHLDNWRFTVNPTVISRLRNLQSLKLPYSRPTGEYGTIWTAFKEERIYLSEITLHDINTRFLDYLESFTGLEFLVLRCSSLHTDPSLASRLYQTSLPKHRQTLHTIEIGRYSDHLAIGLERAGAFTGFENLFSLSVPLLANDVHPGEGKERDVVTALIVNLIQLPYLEYIKLDGPVEREPALLLDREHLISMERMRRRVVESLERFRLPEKQLPDPGWVPPFLVSTLTPNGHYLDKRQEENGILAFVRERTYDGDDSFVYFNLDNPNDHSGSESDETVGW